MSPFALTCFNFSSSAHDFFLSLPFSFSSKLKKSLRPNWGGGEKRPHPNSPPGGEAVTGSTGGGVAVSCRSGSSSYKHRQARCPSRQTGTVRASSLSASRAPSLVAGNLVVSRKRRNELLCRLRHGESRWLDYASACATLVRLVRWIDIWHEHRTESCPSSWC